MSATQMGHKRVCMCVWGGLLGGCLCVDILRKKKYQSWKIQKKEHTSVFLFVTVILFNLQPSTRNTSSAPTYKVIHPKGVNSFKINQFNKRNQKKKKTHNKMNHPCPIIVHQKCSKQTPKMELVQKA